MIIHNFETAWLKQTFNNLYSWSYISVQFVKWLLCWLYNKDSYTERLLMYIF